MAMVPGWVNTSSIFPARVSMGINRGNVLSADSRFSSEYSWSSTRIFVWVIACVRSEASISGNCEMISGTDSWYTNVPCISCCANGSVCVSRRMRSRLGLLYSMLYSYRTKAVSRLVQAIPITKLTREIVTNNLFRHQLRRTNFRMYIFNILICYLKSRSICYPGLVERYLLLTQGCRDEILRSCPGWQELTE